jgi:hypothetical protein
MTRDNDDSLLRSIALQNAESIRVVRLRAEQISRMTASSSAI